MIRKAELRDIKLLSELFADWQESCIWSCLQGVMGELFIPGEGTPESVMAVLGDFSFFAGKADKGLVKYKPESCKKDFMIMVPQNDAWAEEIELCYGEWAKRVTRYAVKKELEIFDKDYLQQLVDTLPPEYLLKRIDRKLFNWCRKESWCRDWCSNYRDYEQYQQLGLGIVCLKGELPVSGASSYSTYQDGIEVEIDTKEEFRRRGLASACGAKLILECLDQGLYPSWDAQNLWSLALAEKLGYHFGHEYAAYEIRGY